MGQVRLGTGGNRNRGERVVKTFKSAHSTTPPERPYMSPDDSSDTRATLYVEDFRLTRVLSLAVGSRRILAGYGAIIEQSWVDSPVANLLAGRDSGTKACRGADSVSFLFLLCSLLFVELNLGSVEGTTDVFAVGSIFY